MPACFCARVLATFAFSLSLAACAWTSSFDLATFALIPAFEFAAFARPPL